MGKILNRFLSQLSRSFMALLVVSLTVLTATADYFFGPEISLGIFYLAPISITAWYGSLLPALFLSVLCSTLTILVAQQGWQTTVVMLWGGVAYVVFFIVVSTLLTRLKAVLENEIVLSRTDHLTGLLNRRALFEQMELIFNLARRQRSPLTLVYLDVDKFKQVNDSAGHKAGDAVLSAVASSLLKYRRRTDLVGRLGGDEFALALPDTDHKAARMLIAQNSLKTDPLFSSKNDPPCLRVDYTASVDKSSGLGPGSPFFAGFWVGDLRLDSLCRNRHESLPVSTIWQ